MTGRALRLLLLSAASLVISPLCSGAQEQPSPAPSATPTATTAVWHNPPYTNLSIVDPCGGPKELLNKINPSPCVLIEGESMVWAGYANVNLNGNLSFTGPENNFELPFSGNANIYPTLSIAFGVSATSQFQITAPSDVNVSTQRLGSAPGTTNLALDYKQLVYVNQTKFTMAAVDLGYLAPTGSSFGPSYHIQPMLYQPLNPNFGIGAVWTLQNSATPVAIGTTQRGWSDPILAYLEWSPAQGGFGFFPIVSHNFNPNRTSVIADVAQQFDRHFLLNVEYGGLGVSAAATGGLNHRFTFGGTVNPRLFAATVYFLIGESNLPPAPASPAPTATP